MPHDADHEPTPDHVHHPLLRITVSACPDDDSGLLVDVDLGQPPDGWTGDQVAAALAAMLANDLGRGIDERWLEVRLARAMQN